MEFEFFVTAKPAPRIIWYQRDPTHQNKTFVLASVVEAISLPVSIPRLNRSHLHAELTCQASNNDRTNLSAVLQIDMNRKYKSVFVVVGIQ